MAYDQTKDFDAFSGKGGSRLGTKVDAGSPNYIPSDTVDFLKYARLVVTTAGNAKFTPVNNADGTEITMTAMPVGYLIPWQVRRVFATGLTAVLHTLEKNY